MSQFPDQHYIDGVLRGDADAFRVLVDRYKNMVFSIALGMLNNREDAEEVSQDVFIKTYKAMGTFRGSAAFSTWLYKITYRSSLDYLKKRRRSTGTVMVRLDEVYPLPTGKAGVQLEEEDERRVIVQKAIEALSGEDQLIIRLFYYEELSLKEISGILEISVNTAKVRLFRGRDRLMQAARSIWQGEKII